jgi:CRISPR-associated endonuclease Csn1
MKTNASPAAARKGTADLELAFDVGHSSIGWAVLQTANNQPTSINLLGCGVVTFGADDCLACKRRTARRQRRHYRSTRQRLERIARVLLKLLAGETEADVPRLLEQLHHYLDRSPEKRAALQGAGHSFPWQLAARVLRSGDEVRQPLTWAELWDVLRWYAHNRGYHGNQRWSSREVVTAFDPGEARHASTAAESDEDEAALVAAAERADAEAGVENEGESDAKKVKEAFRWMRDYGTTTMAETMTAHVEKFEKDAIGHQRGRLKEKPKRFKGLGAAFPRRAIRLINEQRTLVRGVEWEVRRILRAHFGKLPGCDEKLERALCGGLPEQPDDWVAIPCPEIKVHKRFEGGLLFGQLVPRFDNRIVAECPVTGGKVPGKHCHEFLEFRWAMTLANVRIGFGSETYRDADGREDKLRPLNADERRKVDARVRRLGFLKVEPDKPGKDGHVRAGKNELRQILIEETKCDRHNLETLLLHPDAKDGLKLLPIKGDTTAFRVAWGAFDDPHQDSQGRHRDDSLRHRFSTQLLRQSQLSLREILKQLDRIGKSEVAARLRAAAEVEAKGKKPKLNPAKLEELLDAKFYCDKLKGRARYSRAKLADAVQQVFHKNKPLHPLQKGGCLCIDREEQERRDACLRQRHDHEAEVQAQGKARAEAEGKSGKRWAAWRRNQREKLRKQLTGFARPSGMAGETNNHLVRHRLSVLQFDAPTNSKRKPGEPKPGLLQDLIEEFAGGDKSRIARITIEAARDLQTMSGMTNKEKAKELTGKIRHHHDMAAGLATKLANERDENGRPFLISPSLIRKARIADDLDWICPYTGRTIEPAGLVHRTFDRDHIIPWSQRLSNALEALVITTREVNLAKKNRTAMQFVKELNQPENRAERDRLGVRTEAQFRAFVDKLRTKGHPDDSRRRKRRKELLLVEKYEEKEFTPGDLTKTRHITKLAAQQLSAAFRDFPDPQRPPVVSITGAVTSAFRDKTWKLLPLLGAANGEVTRLHEEKQKANAEGRDFNLKKAVRDVTHLHHAIDAISIGLITALLVPPGDTGRAGLNGELARLIHKGKLNAEERKRFEELRHQLGLPKFYRWAGGRCDDEDKRQPQANQGGMLCIDDLPEAVKQQIRARLAEKRVVQHIAADMSGLGRRLEENTRGVVVDSSGQPIMADGAIKLRQRSRDAGGKLTPSDEAYSYEAPQKLLGLRPQGTGKMKAHRGVRVIRDNFGLAILDLAPEGTPRFKVIPWHKVWHQIHRGLDGQPSLVKLNGGKKPRILRNGMSIRIGKFKVLKPTRTLENSEWTVDSIGDFDGTIKVDLKPRDVVDTRYEVPDPNDPTGRKKIKKTTEGCKLSTDFERVYEGGLTISSHRLTG